MSGQESLRRRRVNIIFDLGYYQQLAEQAEGRRFTLATLAGRALDLLLYIDSHPDHEVVVTNDGLALSGLAGVMVRAPLLEWRPGTSNIKRQAERNANGTLSLHFPSGFHARLISLADRADCSVTHLTKTALHLEAKLFDMITSPPPETASVTTPNELVLVHSSDPDWGLKLPAGIMVRHLDIPLLEALGKN